MGEAFFHRVDTKKLISRLSQCDGWTFYLGSGSTIDRTGLSWRALISKLLDPFTGSPSLSGAIVEAHGEIRAASLLDAAYESQGDEQTRDDDIRRLLYGGRSKLGGFLLQNIARFSARLATEGQSVMIFTTNYDSYLADELYRFYSNDKYDFEVRLVLSEEAMGGDNSVQLTSPGTVTLLQLHGFIPQRNRIGAADPYEGRYMPAILSEWDYFRFHKPNQLLLEEGFRDRNVLLIGTGLTDPPLVEALWSTRTDRGDRWALLPRQSSITGGMDRTLLLELEPWNTRRLTSLSISPVYPDFFCQSAQFVYEIELCRLHADSAQYESGYHPRSYGQRLLTWWREWSSAHLGAFEEAQAADHKALAQIVEQARRISPAEVFKVDLWVRWAPGELRELRLWATSEGVLADPALMRQEKIVQDSPSLAVQAFTNGAPTLSHNPDPMDARWLSHLSVPLSAGDERGHVISAVIRLSSMQEPGSSALGESNLKSMEPVVQALRTEGATLLSS